MFYKGLDGLIGAPDKNVKGALEEEHASDRPFTTPNYGVRTTPRKEYGFVVRCTPAQPNRDGTVREPLDLRALHDSGVMRERIVRQWELANESFGTVFSTKALTQDRVEALNIHIEELIALRLYTGPQPRNSTPLR